MYKKSLFYLTIFLGLITVSISKSLASSSLLSFTQELYEEVWNDGPGRALCLVQGEKLQGSGVLVQLGDNMCVLTAAHLGAGKNVIFLTPDKASNHLKLDATNFKVMQSMRFQKTQDVNCLQSDLQLLLLTKTPNVVPLKISQSDKVSGPLFVYGFGALLAEHRPGTLSMQTPTTAHANDHTHTHTQQQ